MLRGRDIESLVMKTQRRAGASPIAAASARVRGRRGGCTHAGRSFAVDVDIDVHPLALRLFPVPQTTIAPGRHSLLLFSGWQQEVCD
jgi:hypothetical protein